MAARGASRRRRGGHEEHENEERWLLTYADMITLLMALFIVMWAISSVNTTKFEALAKSLKDAFSGQILPGGEAVVQPGSSSQADPAPAEPPIPALTPVEKVAEAQAAAGAARREQDDFEQLKRDIDSYVDAHGLAREVETEIAARGLVVRVLTDRVLFASGSATVKPEADGLLDALGRLLKVEVRHPIQVEGNTDSVPVSGGGFPSNWELSTARASTVVRELIARRVDPDRLSALGYADRRPVAPNASEVGRRSNRRVELVLLRQDGAVQGRKTRTQGGTAP